jgi:hypothetical protein
MSAPAKWAAVGLQYAAVAPRWPPVGAPQDYSLFLEDWTTPFLLPLK